MDRILIDQLEVFYRVGVPDAERAEPQRLLLNIELETDFHGAAATDTLARTVDYYAVCQRLLDFGRDREWHLIETLASEVAETLRREFDVPRVTVEVRKFIIPQARFVAVRVSRGDPSGSLHSIRPAGR
jgi:dihydroneopterin aldolase